MPEGVKHQNDFLNLHHNVHVHKPPVSKSRNKANLFQLILRACSIYILDVLHPYLHLHFVINSKAVEKVLEFVAVLYLYHIISINLYI